MLRICCRLLLWCLLLPPALCCGAQDLATGAAGGVVVDAEGSAVPGAQVVLDAPAIRVHREAVSDAQGEFLFPQLAPGTYTLRVQQQNFQAKEVVGVAVALGQTVRLRIQLQVAAARQSIAVSADAVEQPSLADAPANAVLSPRELLALPLDGRRFQTFALLTPLVQLADNTADEADGSTSSGADEADSTSAATDSDVPQVSVRGIDPSQNGFAQDGSVAVRAFDGLPRGGALLPFTVPLEAVREFQVRAVSSGLLPSGQNGSHVGGSVNAVTRRGETTLHGSAFFLLRNNATGAADPFAIATHYNGGAPYSEAVKPRDQREQFGGSVGRVLPHTGGRLFGFVAAEGQRRSFPAISSPDNANFFTLTPTQNALLGNRGVSRAAVAKGLAFLDSLTGEIPRQANELAVTPRLDLDAGARSTIVASYTGVRFHSPGGARNRVVVPVSREQLGTLRTVTDTLDAGWSVALSHRWLQHLQGSVSRDTLTIEPSAALSQEPATGPAGAVPQVSIDLANAVSGGAFRFGSSAALATRRLPDERRADAVETLTFNGRAHTVTLSATGSLIDTAIDNGLFPGGAYQFSSGSTNGHAGGLVDFLTDYTYAATSYPNGGCPSIYAAVHLFCFSSFTQSFGAGTSIRFHTGEAAFALGEGWRLTPRLRADTGARYEYFRMPPPQVANPTLDAVFGNIGATNFLPGDPGNLAPHLGIAYGVSERTVVRIGYGIEFGRVPGRVLQQVLQGTAQPLSSQTLRITPVDSVDPACASAGTNFGYPATYACVPAGAIAKTGSAVILSKHFQLPMVQQAGLTVERELRRGLQVSAGYALSLEHELPNSVDANIAPAVASANFVIQRPNSTGPDGANDGYLFHVPLYTARVSPNFGPVTAVLSNGNGVAHAGVLQVRGQAARELTVRGSYTFSKALDNVRFTGARVDEDAAVDPFQPAYDRAPSNLDRQQKVVATAIWSPQIDRAGAWVRRFASGWSVAPIVFATTGRPYSYRIQGGPLLSGGRESINGSGGATYLPSVGRNTLRLPWTDSVDLHVSRALPVRGGLVARLSAEAFNVANHRNLTAVQQRAFSVGTAVNRVTPLVFQDAATIAAEGLTVQPFGTPTVAGSGFTQQRRLQFGIRLDW